MTFKSLSSVPSAREKRREKLFCMQCEGAVLELMSGKWTISGQLLRVYGLSSSSTERMSGQKRPRADEAPSTSIPPAKRVVVNKRTADKWLAEYDKGLGMS